MGWLTGVTGVLAPLFIVMSPFLSYGDQALSMHRNKSSAGFSLDIPLIMLVASMLRYIDHTAMEDGKSKKRGDQQGHVKD